MDAPWRYLVSTPASRRRCNPECFSPDLRTLTDTRGIFLRLAALCGDRNVGGCWRENVNARDARLPNVDYQCKVGVRAGDQSWVLGRVMRDLQQWMPEELKNEIERKRELTGHISLVISVFCATSETGKMVRDWVWYLGLFVLPIQLGVAAIPCTLNGNWAILMITGAGTLLAIITGALPQWRREKLFCRSHSNKDIAITRGNGSRNVLFILGNDEGFDLEDLSTAHGHNMSSTIINLSVLTVLWLALLITVADLEQDTWYMLCVGGIGVVQNVIVASAPRKLPAYGIHLDYEKVITGNRVMEVLKSAETYYPGLGERLVGTFFPGYDLRPDEEAFWKGAKESKMERRAQQDRDRLDRRTRAAGQGERAIV